MIHLPSAGSEVRLLLAALLVCAACLTALGQDRVPAPRVHDPSTIVKCQDEYWLFCTGRGIASRHSRDLTHWAEGPPVLALAPAWTKQIVPDFRDYYWAPDVIYHDGRYLLYYSVSSWGVNTSAIGLAVSTTLDPTDPHYHWSDQGIVIESSKANDYNAIDPCVARDAEGKLWLAFGSFWSGIKLVQLDSATGSRLAPDSPVYALAHHDSIEAPCLYYHDGFYYLFVNWGLCCRGVESTYSIRVGRSRRITGPYLDRKGVDMLHDGGSPFLDTAGPVIGPGHLGILAEGGKYWASFHYYDGARGGAPTLGLRALSWDGEGWPVIAAG